MLRIKKLSSKSMGQVKPLVAQISPQFGLLTKACVMVAPDFAHCLVGSIIIANSNTVDKQATGCRSAHTLITVLSAWRDLPIRRRERTEGVAWTMVTVSVVITRTLYPFIGAFAGAPTSGTCFFKWSFKWVSIKATDVMQGHQYRALSWRPS